MNINDLKSLIRYTVTNNKLLQDQKKLPIAMAIEGHTGIGKTSVVMQIASSLGISCRKLNIAQVEELGDLIGYPIKEFMFQHKDSGEFIFVEESLVPYAISVGHKPTLVKRMGYAPPQWLPNEENGILLVDDWNRAEMRVIQAMMEILDRQEYISWKLPKGWNIILTSNPDNSEYIVTSLDDAQKTRFAKYTLDFNIESWAEWAENYGIDGRCINFLLMHPEVVNNKCNPRSITYFFNSLESIDNFSKTDNISIITNLGEGSLGIEFTSLFITFIHNKLDKLIQPKEILENNLEDVHNTMRSLLGRDSNYRADIAGILTTRLVNYSIYLHSNKEFKREFSKRIVEILTQDYISEDLKLYAVRKLISYNHLAFQDLKYNSNLMKYVLQ